LKKIEDELEVMTKDTEVNVVDLECKVYDYKKLKTNMKDERKAFFDMVNPMSSKIENKILQNIILCNRIDESL
jgi:uncharacterized FlgJ-related protein